MLYKSLLFDWNEFNRFHSDNKIKENKNKKFYSIQVCATTKCCLIMGCQKESFSAFNLLWAFAFYLRKFPKTSLNSPEKKFLASKVTLLSINLKI